MDFLSALFAAGQTGLSLFNAAGEADAARAQGESQANAYNFDAAQSLIAAQIAQTNARMAMLEASGRIGQVDQKAEAIIGHNQADAAARGVDVSYGAPVSNAAHIAAQANVDRQLIGAQGNTQAASFYNQAVGQYGQAAQNFVAADRARAAARYGVGTAWLGGLTGGLRSLAGLKWGESGTPGKTGAGGFNINNPWG